MEYEFENSDALDYLAECADGYSRIFRVVGSRTIKATFEASKTRWMIIELDLSQYPMTDDTEIILKLRSPGSTMTVLRNKILEDSDRIKEKVGYIIKAIMAEYSPGD